MAFFFKEAHRFEQRQRGCNRPFWQAIRARWLLVSLPANSLTGRRDLAAHQRALVQRTLQGLDWPVSEIQIHDEMIFCIKKVKSGWPLESNAARNPQARKPAGLRPGAVYAAAVRR